MPIFLRKFWTRKLNEKMNPPDESKPTQKTPVDNIQRGPDARSKYKK
tara:strand:- start:883 stop:1023 length:141 start_codon:yes stop_codon:yes gene_type:complete